MAFPPSLPTLLESVKTSEAWARVNLGLTSEEFGRLDASEFGEYVKQWKLREYREDYRLALLRYTVCAAMGCKTKDGSPLQFADFAPANPITKRKPRRRQPSGKMLLMQFKVMCRLAGIEVTDNRGKPNGQ